MDADTDSNNCVFPLMEFSVILTLFQGHGRADTELELKVFHGKFLSDQVQYCCMIARYIDYITQIYVPFLTSAYIQGR